MKSKEKLAIEKFNNGEVALVSTFIDEDTIIMGYGKLNITFEYPLPDYIICLFYGTTSWSKYFENKNIHRYKVINNKTKEVSISPYFTEEEFLRTIKLNNNYMFEKLTQ